jgi:hypothetical protein
VEYVILLALPFGAILLGVALDSIPEIMDSIRFLFESLLYVFKPASGLAEQPPRMASAHAAQIIDPDDFTEDERWRLMRLIARLMPVAAGMRWLAEAESFLREAPAELREPALRSYLVGVPVVIMMSWIAVLVRYVWTTRGPAS